MTVAVQGTTPETFEIKSATLPLVALVLKSADLGALARELEARFGDIPDFFDHDALVVDLSRLESQAQGGERQAVDFPGPSCSSPTTGSPIQPSRVSSGSQSSPARLASSPGNVDLTPFRPARLRRRAVPDTLRP